MKFSQEFGPGDSGVSFPPKGKFFHITPTPNTPGIDANGLVRGIVRTTNGVETQKKIYLTTSFWGIDNIFPSIEGWHHKDMSVYEVDLKGFTPRAEPDPEYMNETFFMVDSDIPQGRVKRLGRVTFTESEGKYYGRLPPKESSPALESVHRNGGGWEVRDSSGTETLGTHKSKDKALSQLDVVEINKMKNEHDEPLPKYANATKVGVYSHGKVVGYAYEFLNGSIDIDGLKFINRAVARAHGYIIQTLPHDYESELGKHFHARV